MASLSLKTIQKLNWISPSYSSFVPDQVLTHSQLNGIIDYFEDQNRMTRLRLSGSGIACGFQLSVIGGKLNLSQGTGITTDGDLIYNTITNGVVYKANCALVEFTNYMEYDDSYTNYFKDLFPGFKEGAILELIPSTAPEISDSIPVQKIELDNFPTVGESIDDYVFFIYLESFDKESGACTSTSCENQGNERVNKVRYLMLPAEYAQAFIDKEDTLYKEKRAHQTFQDGLKKLQVKRLIFNSGTNVLTANSSSQVASYYYNAIQEGSTLTDLKDGLNLMYEKLGLEELDSDFNSLLNFSSASIPADVQYRFDLFKDLVETYNEARDLLMHIDTYCCPQIHSFPKHLMVSGFYTSNNTLTMTSHYRHDFYESPIVGDNKTNYLNLLALVERARTLISSYTTTNKGDQTVITPSNVNGTLGSKAIPFYYVPSTDLLSAWDFDKTSSRLQKTHLSYNKGLLSGEPAIQNPLAYTIDENDFYRIEGHQGKEPQTVKNELEELKRVYGLDFDILIADVSDSDQSLSVLVEKRPSITHLAGVPKGGTFVLASENNAVFADFAITGKIQVENTGVGCCPLVECSYPFISSLKYLNNLSRSLNGSQSSTIIMPSYYILRVTRYEINGRSMKTTLSPEDILVPLTDIFLRRTHAITQALNNRYPKGVVFDYNESQKRFTITRSKYDKYVIEMEDVTLSSLNIAISQPVYTYSNTGMFCASSAGRTGISGTHRPMVMVCRELREYNEAFYESLQSTHAPIAKDDDLTQYRDDWEAFNKLKWRLPQNELIKDVRFVNKQTELPSEQQRTLTQMMNNMNGVLPSLGGATDQSANLSYKLDGDWVTGEFVTLDMYNIWKNFDPIQKALTPEREIYEFVEMKKHLHEDRGVTKMSVYISGAQYVSAFDPVIATYEDQIDFYFSCNSRGEYAIPLSLNNPSGGGGSTDPGPGDVTTPIDSDVEPNTGTDTPATGGGIFTEPSTGTPVTGGNGGEIIDVEINDPSITQFRVAEVIDPEIDRSKLIGDAFSGTTMQRETTDPSSAEILPSNIERASAEINPTAATTNFNIGAARASMPKSESTNEPKVQNTIVGKATTTTANRSIETTPTPIARTSRKAVEPIKTPARASRPTSTKAPENKATVAKVPAKKTAVPKAVTPKVAPKKAAAKKAPAKKATPKVASTKTTAKKAVAKKATSTKKAAPKVASTKTTAKKAATAAKKPTAAKARATRKRNTKK